MKKEELTKRLEYLLNNQKGELNKNWFIIMTKSKLKYIIYIEKVIKGVGNACIKGKGFILTQSHKEIPKQHTCIELLESDIFRICKAELYAVKAVFRKVFNLPPDTPIDIVNGNLQIKGAPPGRSLNTPDKNGDVFTKESKITIPFNFNTTKTCDF